MSVDLITSTGSKKLKNSPFLSENFLLDNETAKSLYFNYAGKWIGGIIQQICYYNSKEYFNL